MTKEKFKTTLEYFLEGKHGSLPNGKNYLPLNFDLLLKDVIAQAIAEHEATDEDIYNEIEKQIFMHGRDNVRIIAQNVANFVKKGKKP